MEKKPQISPLRCAPVEMTNLLHLWLQSTEGDEVLACNKFVISTGAQRSGEICEIDTTETLIYRHGEL
jgi:hypothetical protein